MILTAPGQPFELCHVPDPIPNKDEAIARVISCGAGLTTQHIRAGRTKINYPRIIGHEITAEIVALGSHVQNLCVGDPVTAYYYLTCGKCYWCLNDRETLCDNFSGYVGKTIDGGYAEFIKLPAKNFAKETLQGTVIPTGQGEETTSRNFVSKADRGQFASIVATQDRGAGAMAVLPSRRLVLRRKLLYAVVFAALASVLGETPIATWLHSFDATFMFDELWL